MKNKLEAIIANLNAQQKKTVQQIEGPVMVIAGPGTGKTHILAARIAYILEHTDTPPHAILALTFTESAAINMRERIVSMIGKPGYYVNIETFHAFCAEVMKSFPEYFPIERNSEPLSDLEKYQLFESIIEDSPIEKLKPINRNLFYLTDIIHAISNLKREGITVADFEKIIKKEFSLNKDKKQTKVELLRFEQNKKKNEELAIIYQNYEKLLRKKLRYDFDDMIAFVVEAFEKNELLLREYQEKLLYFLVDEYQDTNSAQNKIINLLTNYWGDKANIFVVGDPHQSIYRFQGASIENTLSFIGQYPHAVVVFLDSGYRCPQIMYDASFEIIQNNTLTKEIANIELINNKLSNAEHKKGEPIEIAYLPSQILEYIYIADSIKKLISTGEKLEDIAVLYRNNADADQIQEALEGYEIPYEIEGGSNILQHQAIEQLIQYMRLINNVKLNRELENMFQVMLYEWTRIDPSLTLKLGRTAGKTNLTIYELIKKGHSFFEEHYEFKDVSPLDFLQAEEFVNSIDHAITKDALLVFTEWFQHIIHESGYMSWVEKHQNKIQLLTNLNSLYNEIKSLVHTNHNIHLDGVIEAFETMQEHNISIQAEDLNVKKGAIHLSTVHKAKGREWKHVFLMGFVDGKWGNGRKRDLIQLPTILKKTDLSKKERNEDDRRLFYVALTRSSKKFYISHPQTIISEGQSRDVIGSMFLEELPKDSFIQLNEDSLSENSVKNLEIILSPKDSPAIFTGEKVFFEKVIKNFKLSVTALNTYLKDRDEFIHNVLLKVPRAKPAPMAFGTAVHYALEQMYKNKMNGKSISLEAVLKAFEESLIKELITKSEFERRLTYGKNILSKYFDEYKGAEIDPIFVERFFGFGFSKTILDDIPLIGRIDRIDWIDKKDRTVRVVDYKTGRSRSVNEISNGRISMPRIVSRLRYNSCSLLRYL
jgi:DNA helicase-2/ATP-dependent DNA helicase PcrA